MANDWQLAEDTDPSLIPDPDVTPDDLEEEVTVGITGLESDEDEEEDELEDDDEDEDDDMDIEDEEDDDDIITETDDDEDSSEQV